MANNRSSNGHRKKIEMKKILNPVVKLWIERQLELVRSRSMWLERGDHFDHFRDQLTDRGITDEQERNTRIYGDPIAIEVESDIPGLKGWLPKYILRWPAGNGEEIVGVYATDGIRLIGVTIYRHSVWFVEKESVAMLP